LLSLDLHDNVADILKLDSLPCSQKPVFEEFTAGNHLPFPEDSVTDLPPEELQGATILSSDLLVNCSARG
jgi:hypothetical protein